MSDEGLSPTLIIRTARWRIVSTLAISASGLLIQIGAFVWIGAVVGRGEALRFFTEEPFYIVLMLLPVLATIILFGSALSDLGRGDFIKLTDKGFSFRKDGRARAVQWTDVKQFRFERPSDSMFASVGWDHQDDAFNGNPIWEGAKWEGKRTTTLDSDIGWGWQGGSEKVCETLEEWRRRYGDR